MNAKVTQFVVEALVPVISYSPTTVTGAGVTKFVTEALVLDSGMDARVTQFVVEALVSATDQTNPSPPSPGGSGPTSFGYAA